jgi:hypothetical protein
MEANQFREPWNKGKLIGQKPPLKPQDIWASRIHLQKEHHVRDLALLNLVIDSKLHGCDWVNLHVRNVTHGNQVCMQSAKSRSTDPECPPSPVRPWIQPVDATDW